MFDREKNLFDAYAAKRISRRDLLDGAAKLGVAGIAANASLRLLGLAGDGGGFQLEEPERQVDQAAAEQASLCRCDDRRPRDIQGADRDERHLRHLSGGRLFRQGDGGAVVEVRPVRCLHDRRVHDLDLWSGRLDRGPQRLHQGPREDQPGLQLGRRAAGIARFDRLGRRRRVRARFGQSQAMVHSMGL